MEEEEKKTKETVSESSSAVQEQGTTRNVFGILSDERQI